MMQHHELLISYSKEGKIQATQLLNRGESPDAKSFGWVREWMTEHRKSTTCFTHHFNSGGFTPFQLKIYETLLQLPIGATASYQALGEKAGFPAAARAVGNAMRRNPFTVLIPCHCVIPQNGKIGAYSSGGPERKIALLKWEKTIRA